MMGRIKVPENGAYLGAYIGLGTNRSWTWGLGGPFDKTVKNFEQATGRKLAINHIYNSWDETNNWDNCQWYWCLSQMLQTIVASGSVPMVSWKPVKWNPTTNSMDLPIRLQEIINGRYDNYIQDWARGAKSFQYPMFLRFGWEMTNGGDPWSGPQNFGRYGNQSWDQVDDLYRYYGDPRKPDGPERYIDAWKHIYDIFRRVQVSNVKWVWSPGLGPVPDLPWNQCENYYPGDEFVDWVGAHIHNYGYWELESGIMPAWRSIDWIFDRYQFGRVYNRYQSKPFMIAEMACSQDQSPGVTGEKATWVTNALSQIRSKYPNVKAVILFSEDKRARGERDFRIDSSPEALEAYRKALSDPYFLDRIMFENGRSTAPPAVLHSAIVMSTVCRTSTERRLRR